MTKISLYKFITTFCLVPTTDIAALAQRVIAFAQRTLGIGAIVALVKMLGTPFWIGAVVAVFTYFPDTISWIFTKIGEIAMNLFIMVIGTLMPSVFSEGSGEYGGWAEMWSGGLSALPSEIVEIMNGLGVAALIGMVMSTAIAVWSIKIFRKVMSRGGLL